MEEVGAVFCCACSSGQEVDRRLGAWGLRGGAQLPVTMRVANAPKLIVDALLQRFLPLARRRVDTAQAQVSFSFGEVCWVFDMSRGIRVGWGGGLGKFRDLNLLAGRSSVTDVTARILLN